MNSYSGFQLLGVSPSDGLSAALHAFEARAEAILATAPVADGQDKLLGDWRSLCESLDWIGRQPQARQPLKEAKCMRCGTPGRAPAIAGAAVSCDNCLSPLLADPIICRSCGLLMGLNWSADPGAITCPNCQFAGFMRTEYGQQRLLIQARCSVCDSTVAFDIEFDLSKASCAICGNAAFVFANPWAFAYTPNVQCDGCGLFSYENPAELLTRRCAACSGTWVLI